MSLETHMCQNELNKYMNQKVSKESSVFNLLKFEINNYLLNEMNWHLIVYSYIFFIFHFNEWITHLFNYLMNLNLIFWSKKGFFQTAGTVAIGSNYNHTLYTLLEKQKQWVYWQWRQQWATIITRENMFYRHIVRTLCCDFTYATVIKHEVKSKKSRRRLIINMYTVDLRESKKQLQERLI